MINYLKNTKIVLSHNAEIKKLKESKYKTDRVLAYLMSGRPVTGLILISKFNVCSYRDVIYELRRRGYRITSETITGKNGINHQLWWLAEFDPDYIKSRKEKI